MKKQHLFALILAICMVLFITLVRSFGREHITENEVEDTALDEYLSEEESDETEDPKKVGVLMPTRYAQRWINDGISMKASLEAMGYEVDLQFADDDIALQVEQIKNMILNRVDCLVIASIDSEALVDELKQAKDNGIFVIAYDRLLMDTDAVSYYATFDNKAEGVMLGQYIVDKMDLEAARKSKKSYTIEFYMGSPDDNNAVFLYDGVMEVLESYLDDGTLVCRSGKTSFEDTSILRWSQETAKQICLKDLQDYYEDDPVDIICSAYDGFCYGIKKALLSENYSKNVDWPLVTGQDAELNAVKDIVAGYQTMTIYKDTRILANKCSTMVQAVLEGTLPDLNDLNQYNNGIKNVPSYLCTPIVIDRDNYEQQLVDGGYYTKLQILGK